MSDDFFATLKRWQDRYHLIRWIYAVIALCSGVVLQASFDVYDWARLPGSNREEIVLVLERMAEWEKNGALFTSMQGTLEQLQKDLQEQGERLGTLKEGQYRIELRVERLDERTGN